MRFVPTNDPSQYVMLTMKDYWSLVPGYTYPIYWQRPSDGEFVDESVTDPTLAATNDLVGNRATRRVKHFSGYLVGVSEVCDAYTDPSCAPVVDFSGYLVGY